MGKVRRNVHAKVGKFVKIRPVNVVFLTHVRKVSVYLREPLLVPARADDESYQLPFLKPTQRQLGTLTQEVQHFIQGQRTHAGHGDKRWRGDE